MNQPTDKYGSLIERFKGLLDHHDSVRGTRDTDLLPIPFAPATWGNLRALEAALRTVCDYCQAPVATPSAERAQVAFCPMSEEGCTETPVCVWPCKKLNGPAASREQQPGSEGGSSSSDASGVVPNANAGSIPAGSALSSERSQEPDAWMSPDKYRPDCIETTARKATAEDWRVRGWEVIPLYKAPVAPNSATSAHKACPYCTSDNEAIRTTYYDQTCEGCVKRMGRP